MNPDHFLSFAVALGIGLLIGVERERSKGSGPERSAAGIRTFTIAALLGAISIMINFWLLVVALACVTVFATTAYVIKKEEDPGLTTEIALLFTVILGSLAMSAPALAAALAVGTAILLAAKEPIHGFVRGVVTRQELNDLLILAAATLIVLPLIPNQFLGPFDAINPRNLWLVVILVMLVSALGHIALRLLGGRIGLPLVGLVSGFISSTATIAAMGARAKQAANLTGAAVSGAMLSNLATILQLALLLAAVHPPTLQAMTIPLVAGGVAVVFYGLLLMLRALRSSHAEIEESGQAVSIKTALILATVIALALLASAALKSWFGEAGLVVASGIAGLADAHASAISVASLAAAGKLSPQAAVLPILVAFSVNATSKTIVAIVSGNKVFAWQVAPGLMIQLASVWLAWWLVKL